MSMDDKKPCYKCGQTVMVSLGGMLLRLDGRPHDCGENWKREHGYGTDSQPSSTGGATCDNPEPGTGYRCERPRGHAGNCRLTFGSDEEGAIPERTWARASDRVTMHVVLEDMDREQAIRIVEDMLYHARRGSTMEGMAPGYVCVRPAGSTSAHDPVGRLRFRDEGSETPAHSPQKFRTSLVDTHEETEMEQRQVLAKWLEMARVVKAKINHGNVEAAHKLIDQLASQLLLGKMFGLPNASPLYREDVHEALNAYTESVVERVTAVCTNGEYDVEKHARNAAALDEVINVLPLRSSASPASVLPKALAMPRRSP